MLDRLLGPIGDQRVDELERDRALLVDPELLEVGDHDARVLARDVGEDDVAMRVAGHALEQGDVADRIRALEQLERALRVVRRRDDPQMDYAGERIAAPAAVGRRHGQLRATCKTRCTAELGFPRRRAESADARA